MGVKIDLRYWMKKYEEDYPMETAGNYPIFVDEKGVGHEEKSPYFESMSAMLRKRGYLLKKEFVSIGKWKTVRQRRRYENNCDEEVERITKKALIAPRKDKVKILAQLEGVGIPVASAILTVVYPKEYCVIDYRTWRVLLWLDMLTKKPSFQFGLYKEYSEFLDKYGQYGTINTYLYFLEQLKKIGEKRNMTPRQVEMAFWKFDELKGVKGQRMKPTFHSGIYSKGRLARALVTTSS